MQRIRPLAAAPALALTLALTLTLGAAFAPPASAAGLLKPVGAQYGDLEIEEHRVRVTINNGFAVTEVDQVFRNPHDVDLEAVYTFPLPREAALGELGLWIDGVEVVGEVVERERARKIAGEEKAAGRETAVAEQREYHAFDVFVSPVRALDTTRVRLVYVQPIEIEAGVGRYVYPLEDGNVDEQAQAFWTRRERVDGTFAFEADVRSSYPLDDVRLKGPGREVVAQAAPDNWSAWLENDRGSVDLGEDVVLYYRLAADQPARVDLLAYRAPGPDGAGPDGEGAAGPGTFMAIVTPGTDLQPTIGGVDWTLVLDLSSSMSQKLAVAADGMAQALDELRPQDRYRIVGFSNRAIPITNGWKAATPDNVRASAQKLRALKVHGGTNLHAGLSSGLGGLDDDRPNAVVLVSDGGANVGPTEHRAFLDLLKGVDVRVFTFVMGQGANRPLLELLAEESNGFAMDISNADDLYGRLVQAREKLGREALHGVELSWQGGGVRDVAPRRLPSAYFGQQIVVFGRYDNPGPVTLRLAGKISGEKKSWATTFDLPGRDERFPEIERLWAFASIRGLQKELDLGGDAELREAIVQLGTEYSLVSEHTSMIVVRPERFEELGIDRANERRVAGERAARADRKRKPSQVTRVDGQRPMFGERAAHQIGGGGGGGGASGPLFLGLIGALAGARAWAARRRRRER